MIPLKDKVNVNAPSSAWPFGELRDNPGDNSGTPVDEALVSDVMQFMESIMNSAGVTANGQLDNNITGFQLFQAFKLCVRDTQANTLLLGTARMATQVETNAGIDQTTIVSPKKLNDRVASEILTGIAEIATQTETNTGTDDLRIITPLKLKTTLGIWTLRSDVADVTVSGGSGTTVTESNIKYKVDLLTKTMSMEILVKVTNTTAPTSFNILIPASKTHNAGFILYNTCFIFDGATRTAGDYAIIQGASQIGVVPPALTNGATTQISFSVTFEIA